MSPLRYLSTLKISQLIQALAGAAHIAYQGGLGVLGSCLCDVCVRDVAVGTAEVLCILPFSEVSNPPPTSCPSLPFPCSPFLPLQRPRSWWMLPQGQASGEAVSALWSAHEQMPLLTQPPSTRVGPWASFLAQEP